MVKSHSRWVDHVRRQLINAPARRMYQMEGSLIGRGRGRPRNITDKTIKKNLDLNGLSIDLDYDGTQRHRLIRSM